MEEGRLSLDGIQVFYRRVPGEGVPTVYCHGNPTHSEDWVPFLERGKHAVAIDMPGWGRSDKPRDFDYTMQGLSALLDRCLDQLEIEKYNLVVHDWGSLALIGAQKHPERVRKLVVIDAVPLLPGYRWHWVARIWRRRPWGEIANATTTRRSLALTLRQARGDRSPMPPELVEMIWRHWDKGTKRAILQLYRDADPDRLAAAGSDLGELACPTLVLWGDRDLYLPAKFAHDYAKAMPNAEAEIVAGAGHWPWIDDPAVIDRVLEFAA